MRAVPFAVRLATVMVAVVLAAAALTVTLDYLKFRRVMQAQENDVYMFMATDLATTIEDSMNLGLPLAALATTEQLIQRRRAAERGTLGITVVDANGTVLFDTDRFRVGQRAPADWLGAAGTERRWTETLPDAYVVGVRIMSSFGQPAGAVVVRYDRVPLETRLTAILLAMMQAALLMVGAAVAVAVAAAVVLTRPHRLWFARAEAQIASLAPGATPVTDPPVPGSEALMVSIKATDEALRATETALIRIGTGDPAAEAELPRAA